MKKLRNKVFWTFFLCLSVFIISILLVNTYRLYKEQNENINLILERSITPFDKGSGPNEIFFYYTVYTVFLDNNEINEIVSNSEVTDNIKVLCNKIIESHKENKHIANLYLERYSYYFNNNVLIVVDNINQNKVMLNNLFNSLLILVLFELIAYIVDFFLTKWIIQPAYDAIDNQKRFTSDASHELKTPLAVIMSSMDAYNIDHNEKWLNNVNVECNKMNKLIKDLLDLSSLENDKEILKKNENLSNIIESEILTFESMFYEKNIKLKYDIKENINFNCNIDSMKELMSILIDNAIKHSDEKGKVIINLENNNKDIILTVSNKGKPIDEKDLNKIFERFYKSDKSRSREKNSYGLGLAIAKRIVLIHNGNILAFSDKGYTTFKIMFKN